MYINLLTVKEEYKVSPRFYYFQDGFNRLIIDFQVKDRILRISICRIECILSKHIA